MKYLQSILAVVTILAITFGGYFYIDNTYAKDANLQLLEQRVDIKILRDASRDYRTDIQYLERQYHNKAMPIDDKIELQELREEKKAIDDEMNMRLQEIIRKK